MGIERLVKGVRNFRRKCRTGLTAGLLGLTAIGMGGCSTAISEGEAVSLLGDLLEKSAEKEGDEGARVTGRLLGQLGSMWYQKEFVREGRTQININQQEQPQRTPENVIYSEGRYFPAPGFAWANPENPNDLTLRRSIGVALTANYWKDFDKDGYADIDELVGVKNKFMVLKTYF